VSYSYRVYSEPRSLKRAERSYGIAHSGGFPLGRISIGMKGIHWLPYNKRKPHFISWVKLDKIAADWPKKD
jgi:hypothetical protein